MGGGAINANGAYVGAYVPNTATTITGTSRTDIGAGGTHPNNYNGSGWGNTGNAGAVIVAYRIA
jgi:hypothetical protein